MSSSHAIQPSRPISEKSQATLFSSILTASISEQKCLFHTFQALEQLVTLSRTQDPLGPGRRCTLMRGR